VIGQPAPGFGSTGLVFSGVRAWCFPWQLLHAVPASSLDRWAVVASQVWKIAGQQGRQRASAAAPSLRTCFCWSPSFLRNLSVFEVGRTAWLIRQPRAQYWRRDSYG